jgi:hypothetical protein
MWAVVSHVPRQFDRRSAFQSAQTVTRTGKSLRMLDLQPRASYAVTGYVLIPVSISLHLRNPLPPSTVYFRTNVAAVPCRRCLLQGIVIEAIAPKQNRKNQIRTGQFLFLFFMEKSIFASMHGKSRIHLEEYPTHCRWDYCSSHFPCCNAYCTTILRKESCLSMRTINLGITFVGNRRRQTM